MVAICLHLYFIDLVYVTDQLFLCFCNYETKSHTHESYVIMYNHKNLETQDYVN